MGFDAPAACALSLVLVASLPSSCGARRLSAPERRRSSSEATRPNRISLGRGRWAAALLLLGLVTLALGVPVGSIVGLLINPGPATLPAAPLGSAPAHGGLRHGGRRAGSSSAP